MLRDPPWFVAEPAIETFNSRSLSAARVDIDCHHVFLEPGEKLRMNLRAQILSRRILGGCGKFRFEFGVLRWIKFEKQSPGILERNLVWRRERLIFFTQRMDGADESRRSLGVGHP